MWITLHTFIVRGQMCCHHSEPRSSLQGQGYRAYNQNSYPVHDSSKLIWTSEISHKMCLWLNIAQWPWTKDICIRSRSCCTQSKMSLFQGHWALLSQRHNKCYLFIWRYRLPYWRPGLQPRNYLYFYEYESGYFFYKTAVHNPRTCLDFISW